MPGEESGAPLALNLTPGSALASWTEAQFVDTIRTGITPHARVLDNEFMPWQHFAKMTDDELEAISLYLQSLPAREFLE